MDDAIQEISLPGIFDLEGEPEIRLMADGALYVVFNFMPPSRAEDDPEAFDDFDQQLSIAAAVPVIWEDREFFRIEHPRSDTVDLITRFLATYPRPDAA